MTDSPEKNESENSAQDMDLEAQLDALLSDLEQVDPQSVPPDLRSKPVDEPGPKAAEPEPEPESEPEAESAPVEAEAEPKTATEPEAQPAVVAEPVTAPEPATEPAPLPAAATEDTSQDSKPKTGLDLETIASMASNLLDEQIDATIEAASQVIEQPADEAQAGVAQTEQPAIEAKADPSESKTGGAVDNDVLGDQIASLLNDIQTNDTAVESGAEPAQASAAEAEPAPVEATSVETEPVAESGDEPGAVSIEQIDAMLAESAEQSLESGTDSDQPVPGTDEILAAQAEAEEEAAQAEALAVASTEPQPAPVAAEPVPIPVPAEAITEAADEPSPQPVQNFEAGADDVARELDEDTAAEPVSAAGAVAESQPAARNETAAGITPGADGKAVSGEAGALEQEAIAGGSLLKQLELRLLKLCAKINKPLYRLSPDMREAVGWVGVVTVGVGLVMTLYGLVF